MKTKLVPYLNFDGKAEEAMKFYHIIFGGELTIQTFGEAFPETPEDMKNRVMHASITAEDISLMASDTHPEHSAPLVMGNSVHITIIGSNEEGLTSLFNKLAESGKIGMPLEKQFWGDIYGSVTDKFGINWMVNISSEKQP